MFRTILYCCLLLFIYTPNNATPGNSSAPLFYLVEDTSLTMSAEQAYQIHHQGHSVKVNQYLNIGFTKSAYWLLFSIDSISKPDSLLLNIGDQHINQIDLFYFDQVPLPLYKTGDYFPFSQRPINAAGYYFPIDKAGTYLVRIDKHYESLQLFFGLKTKEEVLATEKDNTAVIALYTGVIGLLLLFGLYLFAISREIIYLFYVLYIAASWLYVLAHTGYGFQYLWPNDPWFASKARPTMSLLSVVLSMQFMETYIGGVRNKKSRLVLKSFAVILLVIILTILLGSYAANTSEWWLYFQYSVPVISTFYILYSMYVLVSKAVRGNRLALFYLVAILSLLIMVSFQLIYYTGTWNVTQTFYNRFGIATAFVVEVIIITAGMAYRFNQYRLDKERLLLEMNRQQKENSRIMMQVQETERGQIANQLHDVAGSLLSAARLNLSSVREKGYVNSIDGQLKIEKAEEAVSIVSETVRNLSHALSPIILQKAGMKTALEKVVSIFNASGKIAIELIVVGFEDAAEKESYYTAIYSIVYELLNNVVKHSHATHALVQVIEHEECFSIIVEDNGVGLDVADISHNKTHGMSGIISKVKYYNGEIVLEKNEPGLITIIELPIKHGAEV